VRPENAASLRVLAKLGFRDEGLLQSYLEVDGAWRDHQLLAMTVDEIGAGLVSRLIRTGHARLS
jgi:ribosomal-protein-alanine N-acetyltransferase